MEGWRDVMIEQMDKRMDDVIIEYKDRGTEGWMM